MRHSVDAGHPGRTAFFRQAASLRRRDERRETEALRKSPSGGTVHPDRNRHGKTRRVEGTAPKRRRKAVPGPLDGRGGRQGKGDEAAPRGEEGRDGFTEPDRTFRLKHGGKPAQGKGRLRTAGLLLKRFLGRPLSTAGSRLSSNSAAGAISAWWVGRTFSSLSAAASNIPPAANRSNAATCTNTVRKSESLSEAYRIHHSLVQKTPERLGCMGTMDACASKDFVPVRTREHVFRVGVNGLLQAYA